jgi:RNA-directed DNA polymerase
MTAAKLVLEPIFEADFLPVSYGFRPKWSAMVTEPALHTTWVRRVRLDRTGAAGPPG